MPWGFLGVVTMAAVAWAVGWYAYRGAERVLGWLLFGRGRWWSSGP